MSFEEFSYAQNLQTKKTTPPINESQKNQKKLPANISTIAVSITSIPEIKSHNEEDSYWFSEKYISLGINILLVMATAYLARYTLGLFKETKKLAQTAIDQGKDFRFHTQAELRAYVSIAPDNKFRRQDPHKNAPYIFRFHAKNEGKTPAKSIRYKVGIRISEQGPSNEDFEKLSWEYTGTTTIMPNQIIMIRSEGGGLFDNDLAAKAEEGKSKKGLLFYGKFIYDDVFGNNYTNKFCFQFHRTASGGFRWSVKEGYHTVE